MSFDFSVFGSEQLDEEFVQWLISDQELDRLLQFARLRGYYENPSRPLALLGGGDAGGESSRPYRQVQEYGLPSRITGVRYHFYGDLLRGEPVRGISRKEVVIENDITWRIDTLVDFLFGKPITIVSRTADSRRAGEIEKILQAIFDANGSESYFQQVALLGSIYGFVDIILRLGPDFFQPTQTSSDVDSVGPGPKPLSAVLKKAREITLETIEAPRSLPLLDEDNYQEILFFVQHYRQLHNRLDTGSGSPAMVDRRGQHGARQKETQNVEVLGPDNWQRYEDDELIAEGTNPLGVVPVVHIQNMPVPHQYEGQSDVEPLIPLQDELNTRLSDRASRITFQSFKMYLGKGIEGFENRAVGPGRMWSTENPDASIEEFGGDDGSPSEQRHIGNIREALEKASGVGSVAAGILTGKVGNLTSAVALQVTLMGLLSKTERKRRTYGQGIKELCGLILLALDKTGVYPNRPDEREIDIRWPNPLPENVTEKLQQAQMKKELGVEEKQVLMELGY